MNKKGRGVEVLIYGFEEQKSEGENSPRNRTKPRVKMMAISRQFTKIASNLLQMEFLLEPVSALAVSAYQRRILKSGKRKKIDVNYVLTNEWKND